ncbi:hypothetical protein K435DRAFT_753198 [Dendrothele bispora CBS 962.96]|uniref:Endo-chitosanase n=1 Tax=Dendrothele bispora (strain CBS 962.96) TaxID=1314807 RepID=A0A4S8M7D9_DENBC|nr:hypothetical protein K435DRAFT_753198 [Dendrothele bispora CBS 962.96]
MLTRAAFYFLLTISISLHTLAAPVVSESGRPSHHHQTQAARRNSIPGRGISSRYEGGNHNVHHVHGRDVARVVSRSDSDHDKDGSDPSEPDDAVDPDSANADPDSPEGDPDTNDKGPDSNPDNSGGPSQIPFQAASDIDAKGIYAAVKGATKEPLEEYQSGQKDKMVTIYGDFMKHEGDAKAMSFIADMDVDCDGSQSCSNNPDGQSQTSYGALNAEKVPFYVIPESFLGKKDGGFIKPNSLGAIICNGKMFYAIMGDTNGDDPQLIGEGSILLARTCFPEENLGGDKGHDKLDVAYLVFGDAVPSGVSEKTIDLQALKELGDRTLRAFQKALGLGSSGSRGSQSERRWFER